MPGYWVGASAYRQIFVSYSFIESGTHDTEYGGWWPGNQ